ncbi:MAG: betaine--homocysteine S-methyltransferase [Litoreibacter sp.]
MTTPRSDGTDALSKLLSERDWLMADGATGTQLFNMGLTTGDAPELWNVDHPERITRLYSEAVEAGSDMFLTNTFGSNAARLKLHDAQDRSFELSRVAAEIGREVVDKAGRPVVVAGSMGPTGEIMAPLGPLTHSAAVEIFHEQAEGLKAGGADVLWVETISAPEELKAAAEAVALADMPWVCTMSFDTAGRTMMGVTAPKMTSIVGRYPNKPIAFGANCGVGSADLLRTILGFGADDAVIISKGNAGIPKYQDGHILYDGTPELMANYACLARDAGARIIGGCCGTTPVHLRAMREALETRPRKEVPSLETIEAEMGAFSSALDGTEAESEAPARRINKRRARA